MLKVPMVYRDARGGAPWQRRCSGPESIVVSRPWLKLGVLFMLWESLHCRVLCAIGGFSRPETCYLPAAESLLQKCPGR